MERRFRAHRDPTRVQEAIANDIRAGNKVEMQAISQRVATQGMKTIALARRYLALRRGQSPL